MMDEIKDTAIKEVKGYSSAYPYICNLKLLPNIDGSWITIQDDVGTSMTVKLSDLINYIAVGFLMEKTEQWTKEAEEAGMTLTEYLESISPLNNKEKASMRKWNDELGV